jgi:hypothetical protein
VPLIGRLTARHISYFRKLRVTGIILPPKRTAITIRITFSDEPTRSAFAILTLSWPSASAGEPSVAGLWKSFDDRTGKPRGLVRITEVSTHIQRRLEKTFPLPGEDPDPKCDKRGARRDQPVIGMIILSGRSKHRR